MWFLNKKGPSGFSPNSAAEEVTQGIDASHLTAIVTGSTLSFNFKWEMEIGSLIDFA